MLGDSDYLAATLQSFKLDLIGEFNTTAVRSPALLYAATAASQPASLPVAPSVKSTPTVKLNEFTLSLDKAADMLTLPHTEIKAKVENTIAVTGIEKLCGAVVKGVKVLPRGRLLVATDTEKSATLLKQSSAHWAPRIAKECCLVIRRCEIVVNGVPRSFNPVSPQATQELYAHNRSAISDPSVITEVRWLNPKALRDPDKKASSLLVTFSDPLCADQCIAQGLAVKLSICYPHRYEEPPTHCYNCQAYGHTQHQCKEKSPTCAHCSLPHRTTACPCTTSSTKCTLGKRCEHFTPRCALCKGKHVSFHKDCPVCIKERELQCIRLRRRVFFDPLFDPYTTPAHSDPSAPFFFDTAAPPPPAMTTPPTSPPLS
jgi:hypothetical protein